MRKKKRGRTRQARPEQQRPRGRPKASRSAATALPAVRDASGSRLQMEDIAQLAGVSTSTVSRALNGSTLVNAETRERIESLARSLNYSVNVGASNLRSQRNRTVAVVLPFDPATRQHVSDPFFVSLLGALADSLTDRGYDMLLSRVDANQLNLAGDLAASGRAIGVIVIGQWHHHDHLNELAARKLPIVVWGAQLSQQLYCTVGGDNTAGGTLATEHLLNSGRRHIAFLGDIELPEVGLRYLGYQRALEKFGIAPSASLLIKTPFVEGSARAAIADLRSRQVPFDAVFASSDLLAMEGISALRDHGIAVPNEVAVVGYDDLVVARYFHPSVTTIRQPVTAGGEALVNALLEIAQGRRAKSLMLATELVVRESSV